MNVINVIQPYRYLDICMFDDTRVGLSAEPFVGGVDTMIDRVTAGIVDANLPSSPIFRRETSRYLRPGETEGADRCARIVPGEQDQ